MSKEVSMTIHYFFLLSFIKKCKLHPNFAFSMFIFLLLLFSYAKVYHLFCAVFMPGLQEAFPMPTFIYLGGVSVDLKADTHQIRKIRTQKTEAKQFEPEMQLMNLDFIKAFDTVPQKISLEKINSGFPGSKNFHVF